MNTAKTILKGMFGSNLIITIMVSLFAFMSVIPIFLSFRLADIKIELVTFDIIVDTFNGINLIEYDKLILISIGIVGTTILLAITAAFIVAYYKLQIANILNISNMEKQSKALRKLGVDEFIKRTESVLIHSSTRGNSLYQSTDIIKNRLVKFLVYKDISTDRMYIKYVPNDFSNADEAQAWSLSMSLERYQKMTIEA